MLVFISFDHAGEALYQSLAKRLREVGVEVMAAGRATTSRANKSLQKADALVVLLTASALKSPRLRGRALWFHTVAQDQPAKRLIPVWVGEGPIADLWPFLTPEMVTTRDLPTAGDDALVAQILAKLDVTPLPVTKPLVASQSAAPSSGSRRKLGALLAVAGALLAVAIGIGLTLTHGRPTNSHGGIILAPSATGTGSIATGNGPHTATATSPSGTATLTPAPSASATSSPTATPTPMPAVIAINAGGPTITNNGSVFKADEYFMGGNDYTIPTNTQINTSKVQNPAPVAVYQTARQGNFTYTLPNLQPGHTYTVRLHFVEYANTLTGEHEFNVFINSKQVLTYFDISVAAGGQDIAVTEDFSVIAKSDGQILINFASIKHKGLAEVSAIEVFG